jgi:hypothetical protein
MSTNFANGVSSYGVPVVGNLPMTSGRYFFVDYTYGNDSNGGRTISNPLKTVAQAYSLARTNKDDVIVLMGNAAHVVTEMLTISKNRVHIVGMDGTGGRLVAQNAKIQMGVTTAVTDIAVILITGVRNSLTNVKVINANTLNECLSVVIDNGEGTLLDNVSMVKTAGLDDAGWCNFWMAGDSLTARNLVLGQSNIPSAVAHYGIKIDGKTGGATDGTVKENFLENVYINMSVSTAAAATACFIKVVDGSALNFNNVIKDLNAVNFVQNGTGTIMSTAVIGAATVGGYLHLIRPSFMGCTGVQGTGSGKGIYISNSVAAVAAGGLATALTD